MPISCPQCASVSALSESEIGPNGCMVRCERCGTTWLARAFEENPYRRMQLQLQPVVPDVSDAVVIELGAPGATTCRLLHELATQHPDVPFVVASRPGAANATGALPRNVLTLPVPSSVNEQVRVVQRAAIDGRRRRTDQGQAARSDADQECSTFT